MNRKQNIHDNFYQQKNQLKSSSWSPSQRNFKKDISTFEEDNTANTIEDRFLLKQMQTIETNDSALLSKND